MSSVIDVTLENFEDVVIHGSMERPVVVDFWANWCAPCKQLGPLLEKLSQELQFVLAKVDTEANQQLAAYFRISSIPDIRIFSQGQMVDSIQGALPESQLRKVLGKHFLSEADKAILEIESFLQQGHPDRALPLIETLLQEKPTEKKVLYCKAKAFVDLGKTDDAKAILQLFHEGDDFFREAKALAELMDFHQECARKDVTDPTGISYQSACALALQGQYREAMEGFLTIVQSQKGWRDDAARKALLTLFGVLGAKHELTWEFRARLNTILFI